MISKGYKAKTCGAIKISDGAALIIQGGIPITV